MTGEQTVEITPDASALIESLRGLGYSPETALADLIDNSIAAAARKVQVDLQHRDGKPTVAILDDGNGMTAATLVAALRLGGIGGLVERDPSDLGRFGLGLKTASLSQCRRLIVVTRQSGSTHALSLDVDVVIKRGWIAVVPDPLPDHPYVAELQSQAHGTVVLWHHLDTQSGLAGLDKETFFLRVQDIRAHLGMVFHRFIDGDARRIAIEINGRAVKGWDPFQRSHPSITELPVERLRHAGVMFTVKPYVLPHRDRFSNDSEYEAAGGPGGWSARQGFYVYRGKRLLVPGSWLGLGSIRAWTRDQSSRLARIEIDLPTSLDQDWRIDVRKSQAKPPGALRARLTAIAGRCREQAREVFAWRGKGARTRSDGEVLPPIWLSTFRPDGNVYRINRDHPAIAGYLAAFGANEKLLDAVLTLVERAVPVERIWLDATESELTPRGGLSSAELEDLTDRLAQVATLLPAAVPLPERVELLVRNLPGDQTILKTKLTERLEAHHG